MTLRTLLALGASCAFLALSGCAFTDPYSDRSPLNDAWGRSHRAQIGEQVADPDAPHSDQGPEGLDASTGERVAKRYYRGQDSQRTRKAETVVIGNVD